MRRRISFVAATLLLGSLSGQPSQAADYFDASVKSVITEQLFVESNGSSYHRMALLSNLVAEVNVELNTGVAGRIVWFTTWLGLGREGLAPQYWPDYREHGHHKSFVPRPKAWSGTVIVGVPGSALEQFVLGQCNYHALTLRQQGLSNKAIFGEDRRIELYVVAHLDHKMTGASGTPLIEGVQIHKTVDLVCQKWPGAVLPQVGNQLDSVPPVVEKASLALLERSGLSGVCKVILSGVIETSVPNTKVRFRYKDDAGHQSSVHEVVTDHTGTVMFDHQYDVPNNPNGGESGKIRIVGVSHPFESAKRSYEMDCTAPATTDLQALLPPTLQMQVVPLEKVMVGQQLCVSRVRIIGKITGRGPMSGYAAFVGDRNYISPPKAYEVEQGEMVLTAAERVLDWAADPQHTLTTGPAPAGQPKSQTIDLGFNVTGSNNAIVASLPKKGFTFTCSFPTLNPAVMGGQGLTVEPSRPAAEPPVLRRLQQKQPGTVQPRLPAREKPSLRLKQ
ncbi:MAG: hypothetical protein ACFCUW_07915 [Kiloniellaceae bacterium]